MRYLLVAADKSKQLPIELPSEIISKKVASKLKAVSSKIKRNKKSKTKIIKKRKQVSKALAK